MATFNVFPTEIWLLILEQLCQCPHCLGSIYDFDLSTYEQAKSDLVALSLTCRDMRHVAQRVLYHSFYGYPFKNTLSKFLCTLIAQPELAGHVRVLILPENLVKPFVLENESEFLTRDHIKNWIMASAKLGIALPFWLFQATMLDESSDAAEFIGSTTGHDQLRLKNPERQFEDRSEYHVLMRELRLWQQLLTIRLVSSGISNLAIIELDGRLAQSSFDFPNLRAVSWSLLRSHEEFHQCFRYAPRLDTIIVGATYGPEKISSQWKLPSSFTNVKTISLACTAPYQGYMLQVCNQVQELELHFLDHDIAKWVAGTIPAPELSNLEPWPTPVKSQLRRLCWSSTAAYTAANFLPTEDEGLNMFPPLSDFKNLETLEIDRLSLDVCVMKDQGSDMSEKEMVRQMPTILPRSLRTLRLMFAEALSWSWLILDLEELASAKDTFLPMLSVVQIDWEPRLMISMPQNEKPLPEVMFDLGVVKAMKDVGIELRFGFRSFSYRGLTRPMPANLDAFWRGCGLVVP